MIFFFLSKYLDDFDVDIESCRVQPHFQQLRKGHFILKLTNYSLHIFLCISFFPFLFFFIGSLSCLLDCPFSVPIFCLNPLFFSVEIQLPGSTFHTDFGDKLLKGRKYTQYGKARCCYCWFFISCKNLTRWLENTTMMIIVIRPMPCHHNIYCVYYLKRKTNDSQKTNNRIIECLMNWVCLIYTPNSYLLLRVYI